MESKLLIVFAILVIIIIIILAPSENGIIASVAVGLILAILLQWPRRERYTDIEGRHLNIGRTTSDIAGNFPDNIEPTGGNNSDLVSYCVDTNTPVYEGAIDYEQQVKMCNTPSQCADTKEAFYGDNIQKNMDGDEQFAFQGRQRYYTERSINGIKDKKNIIDKYLRNELEQSERENGWWGHNEY